MRPSQKLFWANILLLTSLVVFFPKQLSAQPPRTPPARLKVFLDCSFECDTEYLRQNIEFVDYVRDRETADLHVLVTTQGTGGGGTSWVVQFLGLQYFHDHDHTLNFTTPQAATSDDKRKEFARLFKIGLVSYAAETTIAPNFEVSIKPVQANAPTRKPTSDGWNYWVFRVGVGGFMNGERTSNSKSYRMNFSASRVTEQWKINFGVFGDTEHSSFEVTDDLTVKSTSNSWNLNSLVVKSWGPQWSVGARSNVSHSSFSNTDRSVSAFPAIEFDFFPYSESSRRSLTVQYSAGLTTYNYRELTIFDRLHETVPSHALQTSIGIRAPWGSLGGSTNISQHLNHLDRYRVSLNGNTDIRLFKGFSFDIYASYDKIGDQIGLRKTDATTEEVLLRLQQRATGYSYYLNFGVNYSFGSIFNSTVNPRFNR